MVPVTNMRYGQDVFCVLQTTLLKLPCLQNVHSTHLTWNHLPTPHILLSLVTSSRSCRSTQKHFKDKCFRLKLVMHQSRSALSQEMFLLCIGSTGVQNILIAFQQCWKCAWWNTVIRISNTNVIFEIEHCKYFMIYMSAFVLLQYQLQSFLENFCVSNVNYHIKDLLMVDSFIGYLNSTFMDHQWIEVHALDTMVQL